MSRALLIFLFTLAGVSHAASAVDELHRFFDREWEHTMRASPTFASSLGDRRWNDQWDDISLTAIAKEQDHRDSALRELRKIKRGDLPAAEQINYDLFEYDLVRDIEQHQYQLYLMPLSHNHGIQTQDDFATELRFETVKDYEDWIARLRSFPEHIDQTIALLRQGIVARKLKPKITMQRVPAQIQKQIVSDPRASGFFKPFTKFPSVVTASTQEKLKNEAALAIRERVVPAYVKLKEFFDLEYFPACFDQVGAWQWNDGAAAYSFLARRFTTTALSPQEIHEIGLSEVRRIRAEMEKVKTAAAFSGTMPQFMEFLRTDPKFYFKTADELLVGYRAIAKETDPLLLKLFRTLPRTPYGVEPIPENIAPDTTTAYYRSPAADGSRAGTYFVNLYKPETRPKWEMVALSLHESVPGHHLQIALAQEQGDLPKFRRFGGFTAFIEGWGLYSEHLGEELGLYKDPYSKFGQLTYEMWRAIRLVVDTGMHSMKWDRQKAIDFFKENAAKTELDIVNEIDRYINTPGQALAYKIGELKIKELRARAEKKLGDKFDVRAFHDELLSAGPLPLDVLEKRMNVWMEKAK
jgi:uncharacterized protein (DUF885 family)